MKNLIVSITFLLIVQALVAQQPVAAMAASLTSNTVAGVPILEDLPCSFTIESLLADRTHPMDAEYAFAWSTDPVDQLIFLRVNASAQSVIAVLISPDGQHHQHSPRMQVDYRHTFDLYSSPAGTYLLEISTSDGHLRKSYSITKQNATIGI